MTTFGDNIEAAGHLVQLDAYLDTDSLVHGFRCHFNNQESTPADWTPGKAIPGIIDGLAGERIDGVHVMWSDANKIANLNVCCDALDKLTRRN